MATFDPEGPSTVLADVSREMVRLYKDQFGRGPGSVRTDWWGGDVAGEEEEIAEPVLRVRRRAGVCFD